jgi:hypothetical protein
MIGIGLQAFFFAVSLIVFISRFSKRKGIIRSVIITGLHGMMLYFTVNLYVKVVIPHQEQDEMTAFKTGASGLIGKFFTKSENETKSTEYPNKISSEVDNNDKEKIEDPF